MITESAIDVVGACMVCGISSSAVVRKVESPNGLKGSGQVSRCRFCGLMRRIVPLKELAGRAVIGRRIYPDFDALEERVATARETLWESIFPRFEPYRKTNKMLDIGSARGHFLSAARRHGWEVQGVEPSVEDSAYAHEKLGVSVQTGTFESVSKGFSAEAFDVVTLWNVLDHFLDPVEALNRIRELLRPGGILALRLPNGPVHLAVHRCFSALGKKDLSVFPNYAFTRKSLAMLLANAGFSSCVIFNAPPTKGDPYSLFKWLRSGTVQGMKRMVFFSSEALYSLSIGRIVAAPSFLAFARKPS